MFLVMVQLFFNVPTILFFWSIYHVILGDSDPRFISHLFPEMFQVLLNWKRYGSLSSYWKNFVSRNFCAFLFALGHELHFVQVHPVHRVLRHDLMFNWLSHVVQFLLNCVWFFLGRAWILLDAFYILALELGCNFLMIIFAF